MGTLNKFIMYFSKLLLTVALSLLSAQSWAGFEFPKKIDTFAYSAESQKVPMNSRLIAWVSDNDSWSINGKSPQIMRSLGNFLVDQKSKRKMPDYFENAVAVYKVSTEKGEKVEFSQDKPLSWKTEAGVFKDIANYLYYPGTDHTNCSNFKKTLSAVDELIVNWSSLDDFARKAESYSQLLLALNGGNRSVAPQNKLYYRICEIYPSDNIEYKVFFIDPTPEVDLKDSFYAVVLMLGFSN